MTCFCCARVIFTGSENNFSPLLPFLKLIFNKTKIIFLDSFIQDNNCRFSGKNSNFNVTRRLMLEKVILPTAQGDDILFLQEATMSSWIFNGKWDFSICLNNFAKFFKILRPKLDHVTHCDYCLDVQLKFRLKLVTKAFLFYDYLSHTPKLWWSSFVYSTKLLQLTIKLIWCCPTPSKDTWKARHKPW